MAQSDRGRRFTVQEKIWVCNQSVINRNLGGHRQTIKDWPFVSPPPNWNAVRSLCSKFNETGSVQNRRISGRKRTVRTDETVHNVSAKIRDDPSTSTRSMAVELGISQTTVVRVLHDAHFKPFRATDVQFLTEEDFHRRYKTNDQNQSSSTKSYK